jgi:hypothetical protein
MIKLSMKFSRGVIGISSLIGLVVLAVALPLLGNLAQKPQDTRNLAVEIKGACDMIGNKCCGPDTKGFRYCTDGLICEGNNPDSVCGKLVYCPSRCSNNYGCQRAKYRAINECENPDGTLKPPAPGTTPEYTDDCSCGPVAGGDNTRCGSYCIGYGTCNKEGLDCCHAEGADPWGTYCEGGNLICDNDASSSTFGKCKLPYCPTVGDDPCVMPDPDICGKYGHKCCTTGTPCEGGFVCDTEGVAGEKNICRSVSYQCAKANPYSAKSNCEILFSKDGSTPKECSTTDDMSCWGYVSTCELNCGQCLKDGDLCCRDGKSSLFCHNGLDCVSGRCKEKVKNWYICGGTGECISRSVYETLEMCRADNGGRTCYETTEKCGEVCGIKAVELFECKAGSCVGTKWGSKSDCLEYEKTLGGLKVCNSKDECEAICKPPVKNNCGDVIHGGKKCDTEKSWVTCNDGTWGEPKGDCKVDQKCVAGDCVSCGKLNEVCCADKQCGDTLTCSSEGKCVKKEEPKSCKDYNGIMVGVGETGCNTKESFATCVNDKEWKDENRCVQRCIDGSCKQISDCKVNKGIDYRGPNAIGGDFDCDGVVDIGDYSVWRKEFLDGKRWKDSTDKINWWANVVDKDGIGGYPDKQTNSHVYSLWREKFKI